MWTDEGHSRLELRQGPLPFVLCFLTLVFAPAGSLVPAAPQAAVDGEDTA
jgi:hypothetical protein